MRPINMEEFAARLVGALEGVGTKIITLGLEQVRRQHSTAVGVKVREGRHETGRCHA